MKKIKNRKHAIIKEQPFKRSKLERWFDAVLQKISQTFKKKTSTRHRRKRNPWYNYG